MKSSSAIDEMDKSDLVKNGETLLSVDPDTSSYIRYILTNMEETIK